jgi:hypothetical protein
LENHCWMWLKGTFIKNKPRCGDILPKYANYFIATFLKCCKEVNENKEIESWIKTSSLSNISTFCEIIKFGIFEYLDDIIDCVSYLITKDEDVNVRKSCVRVFKSIFYTFRGDSFKILDEKTKQIIVILKNVSFYDHDELVKYNSKILLEEIYSITKEKIVPFQPNSILKFI